MIARRFPAATMALAVTVALGACDGATEPAPSPTSTSTLSTAAGTLTPADPAPSILEDTPEVQVLRRTLTAVAWATLMVSCTSEEYQVLADPGIYSCPIAYDYLEYYKHGQRSFPIGPDPFTPVSIESDLDGMVRVTACVARPFELYVDEDGESYAGYRWPHQELYLYTLSPLTAAELAQVAELTSDPPAFRVRGYVPMGEYCDETPVTLQTFDDWRETTVFLGGDRD